VRWSLDRQTLVQACVNRRRLHPQNPENRSNKPNQICTGQAAIAWASIAQRRILRPSATGTAKKEDLAKMRLCSRFAGMGIADVERQKQRENENAKRKRFDADLAGNKTGLYIPDLEG